MPSKDDLLLIAGKGHETGQTIKGVTHPFDDAGVAASWRRRGVSALWTSAEIAAPRRADDHGAFEAQGVTFDSARSAKGGLFVALEGETTDGHRFVDAAFEAGAAAAVVSRDVDGAGRPLVRVRDTMGALVASRPRRPPAQQGRIASVTGSVGKTSTKDALRAALAAQAPTSASAGKATTTIPACRSAWRGCRARRASACSRSG